jgi:hypothetical protein
MERVKGGRNEKDIGMSFGPAAQPQIPNTGSVGENYLLQDR